MKKVFLSESNYFLVDDEDYDCVNKFKWQLSNSGYVMRCAHLGYNNGKRLIKGLLLHRFILNAENGQYVDHKDGNKLNNCRSNLRICTLSENQYNKRKNKNNTSGFKGVCWHKNKNKWQVQIEFNKTRKYLGVFDDVIEAAKTYNEAAIKYHGRFAKLNEIPD